MNERFEEMKSLLDNRRYFKLVCGAGNEDKEEVRKLALLYTLGGANGFDVSASPEVVEACAKGIDRAFEVAKKHQINIPNRPFITVSVGMPGDHHVRKAIISQEKCIECDLCIPACPTDAIPASLVVIPELCIGCGHCDAACPPKVAAIYYEHNDKSLRELLPRCLEAGAENIELHAAVPDDDQILEEWKVVSEANPNNYISMCLDRFHLSNFRLFDRIRQAKEIAGDRLVIQADGVPMSGGSDNMNTTLQAIAIADIINKEFREKRKNQGGLDIPILLSGGTNGQTAEMAHVCGVDYEGLSIGTHARKIVKEFTHSDTLDHNEAEILKGADVARSLVSKQFEYLN